MKPYPYLDERDKVERQHGARPWRGGLPLPGQLRMHLKLGWVGGRGGARARARARAIGLGLGLGFPPRSPVGARVPACAHAPERCRPASHGQSSGEVWGRVGTLALTLTQTLPTTLFPTRTDTNLHRAAKVPKHLGELDLVRVRVRVRARVPIACAARNPTGTGDRNPSSIGTGDRKLDLVAISRRLAPRLGPRPSRALSTGLISRDLAPISRDLAAISRHLAAISRRATHAMERVHHLVRARVRLA